VYSGKFDSLFLNNPDNDHDATVHLIRVCHLTEMLYNNQWLKEYAACIKQFRTPTQIESTYAELDIARTMIATKVKFAFNEITFKKGSDFDLLITFPNGLTACG